MLRPVPGLPIEQQPVKPLSRMLLYGETRGEPAIGKLAVLAVAYNRAEKRKQSVSQVILAPKQFSSFNEDDPNRGKLLMAHVDDVAAWAGCDAIAELWESAMIADPTKGADHYYNPKLANPPWGRGHPDWKETVVIGDHVFGIAP